MRTWNAVTYIGSSGFNFVVGIKQTFIRSLVHSVGEKKWQSKASIDCTSQWFSLQIEVLWWKDALKMVGTQISKLHKTWKQVPTELQEGNLQEEPPTQLVCTWLDHDLLFFSQKEKPGFATETWSPLYPHQWMPCATGRSTSAGSPTEQNRMQLTKKCVSSRVAA